VLEFNYNTRYFHLLFLPVSPFGELAVVAVEHLFHYSIVHRIEGCGNWQLGLGVADEDGFANYVWIPPPGR
jgi:hypothetical protein